MFLFGRAWRKNVSELFLIALTWVDIFFATFDNDSESTQFQSLLLFARLLRVVRVFRVRVFIELFMMVNGVIGSCRTLLYSMVLITLPLYCVALVLTETLGYSAADGRGAEKFEHLEESLLTVFRCFVASDCTQEDGKPLIVLIAHTYGWAYGLLYCMVQFTMTFGLYNVITAIYVEKSVVAAKYNELAVKRRRFQDRQYFEKKAKAMLEVIWQFYFAHEDPRKGGAVEFDLKAAGQLQLTRGFFADLCKQRSFVSILRSLDISEDDQLDLFDTLDIEGRGAIDPMSLVVGVGKLRGEARKADIVTMGLILKSLQTKLGEIEGMLSQGATRSFTLRSKEEGS